MKHSRSVFAMTAGGTSLMIAALVLAAPEEDRFPISVDALHAKSTEIFSRVDVDGDGLISFDEFAGHDPKHRGRHSDRHRRGADYRGEEGERSSRHETAMSGYRTAMSGYRPAMSGYRPAMSGSKTAMSGYETAMSGYETAMSQMDPALFESLDSNANGVIEASEFSSKALAEARASVMKQQTFARMDVNDDSVLTPEEFPPSRLAGLDTDGDGEITREEMRDGQAEHWRRAG
jgi:Ca2+-binding EF-hand superfamily protein